MTVDCLFVLLLLLHYRTTSKVVVEEPLGEVVYEWISASVYARVGASMVGGGGEWEGRGPDAWGGGGGLTATH
jgi:hypothetical protein